jgi:hypothetical protein
MTDTEFHNNKQSREKYLVWIHSPTLQPLLQSLLSTLADVNFAYERERNKFSKNSSDSDLRIYVLEKLKVQHQSRRTPYLQHISTLQEQMLSS